MSDNSPFANESSEVPTMVFASKPSVDHAKKFIIAELNYHWCRPVVFATHGITFKGNRKGCIYHYLISRKLHGRHSLINKVE